MSLVPMAPQIQNPDDARWRAVLERDPEQDGRFVYAVHTTGVYCRPVCPSRRALRANVSFFKSALAARASGFRACKRCRPDALGAHDQAKERALEACRYIEAQVDRIPTLSELGRAVGLSPAHLQRVFKQYVGLSPLEYAEAVRMHQLKLALRQGTSVTDAIYASGFSSSSRVYERAARSMGMTPRRYRERGRGERIRYSVVPSALGQLLVASTDKGICAVQLGDEADGLQRLLREEFSAAEIVHDDRTHADWVRGVVAIAEGQAPNESLPLDVRGTAFQMLVWRALRKIPRGETRSYAEVAQSIGRPEAVRAVANACGANPTALVVPCHRVVQSDGGLGGYHWGIERKRRLLGAERKG